MFDNVAFSVSRKYKCSSHVCDTEWGIKSQANGRSYCPGLTTLLNIPTGQSKFQLIKASSKKCVFMFVCACKYTCLSIVGLDITYIYVVIHTYIHTYVVFYSVVIFVSGTSGSGRLNKGKKRTYMWFQKHIYNSYTYICIKMAEKWQHGIADVFVNVKHRTLKV